MALIIKSLAVDPPNYDELSDDEDDFVKDPAQYRDPLPQPYRFVDELLTLFLDDVWDEITVREDEKAAERSKIRPPKYECAVQLQEHPLTKAMVSSADGRYLFVAFMGGLSVFDASKKKVLHTYEDDHLDIHTLNCTIIGVEIYLLTGIDELGMCHVFGCAAEKIFVMKVLNEEASNKLQAVKCETSLDGDFLGAVFENPSNNDTVLEVYQLPRDAWVKEIEEIRAKILQAGEAKSSELPPAHQPATGTEAEDGQVDNASKEPGAAEAGDENEGIISGQKSTDSVGSKKGTTYKFTAATMVMKHHPPEKLQANQGVSPSATLKELADPKLILGSGQGHLLTRPYMEIRQEAFNDMHKDRLMYKHTENENESKHLDCNFHFFTPGLAVPFGIEQPGALKKPTFIGVWWSGSSQFIYYSLTRPVKAKKTDNPDAELDIKPETVWPQAAEITASAMSSDSTLVAIGLKNGIVTIWDKHLCCMRKSVLVCKSAVAKLDFVDPSVCPQYNNRQQCYPTTTSCYVLVRGTDSSLHLLNCGQLDFSPPITVAGKATDDDNVITSIELFPSKCPELIMKVTKNGCMFLQDIISMQTLCEISLSNTHELTTPWQPILSIAACGQMLYIKGTQKTDEDYVDKSHTSIFVFHFRSFPALDPYWMKSRPEVNYLVMSPIETRITALLSNRVRSSGARQKNLQKRWPLMKQEMARIAQIKTN